MCSDDREKVYYTTLDAGRLALMCDMSPQLHTENSRWLVTLADCVVTLRARLYTVQYGV